ncbi:5'-nucleotidase domain-containing protein 1 isoform X1 [Venturia canescens]|uniref:5'-nucleotidase domain-containing protein 1 isoform X1 n=1 Tax=Venturia canescens TaxID=32260 RepID=UPI001C9BF2E8|nr:5'-nucleotidase domain-containing protein 1 isoform X1 [Venturia canescens]
MIKATKLFCRAQRNWNYIQKKIRTGNSELLKLNIISSCNRSLETLSESSGNNNQKMDFLKLNDYDCVGFDLDHCLASYDITNLVRFEFELLSKFMVEQRGWDNSLNDPLLDADIDFMQKGLVLDFDGGNILKLRSDGSIFRASHGTKLMTQEELEKKYPHGRWKEASALAEDSLKVWNGPASLKVRSLLDYFDMPVSLVFARAVDACDRKGKIEGNYNIWPDILDGLTYMFDMNRIETNKGGYFSELKNHPEKYINRNNPRMIDWIRELKRQKFTFLITGAYAHCADLVATAALGNNWRELFDIVVCYAKKPGFFTDQRPFLKLSGTQEVEAVEPGLLMRGEVYSRGNWRELEEFFCQETKKHSPKCLYFGDNVIQDIYSPCTATKCDTIAISEELMAEGMVNKDFIYPHKKILTSQIWGSYFSEETTGVVNPTLWCHIIKKSSRLCVPSMDFVVVDDFDREYKCSAGNAGAAFGFYPAEPLSMKMSSDKKIDPEYKNDSYNSGNHEPTEEFIEKPQQDQQNDI